MARILSDEEASAYAREHGLLAAGDEPNREVLRLAKKQALEADQQPAPPPVGPQLGSRATHEVPGGRLQVDVLFIPTTK